MYKLGDILVTKSSYNMTFVYFWKVVDVSKTGKTIKYQRMGNTIVKSCPHGFSGTVVADTTGAMPDGYEIMSSRSSRAPKTWDGTPQYFNHLD